MKITSWNCCQVLRNKYNGLTKFDKGQAKSDIYVIMECENPEKSSDSEYKKLLKNGFWKGTLNHKGLAIFSPDPNVKLELIDWPGKECEHFIPVRVNDVFTLVGVWACDPYCAMFYDYLQQIKEYITKDTIFIGDFNSNIKFDKAQKKSGKTWSSCLSIAREKGLVDIYNSIKGEDEGKETTPTFFLYRHLDRPDHIDHCLANPDMIKSMKILVKAEWLSLSDHLPLVVDVKSED